jgi:hypothetical protein
MQPGRGTFMARHEVTLVDKVWATPNVPDLNGTQATQPPHPAAKMMQGGLGTHPERCPGEQAWLLVLKTPQSCCLGTIRRVGSCRRKTRQPIGNMVIAVGRKFLVFT